MYVYSCSVPFITAFMDVLVAKYSTCRLDGAKVKWIALLPVISFFIFILSLICGKLLCEV